MFQWGNPKALSGLFEAILLFVPHIMDLVGNDEKRKALSFMYFIKARSLNLISRKALIPLVLVLTKNFKQSKKATAGAIRTNLINDSLDWDLFY